MSITYLLLASQSPRRREMVTWLNLPVHVTSAEIDEQPKSGESPAAMSVRLALAKAQMIKPSSADVWVLAADTIVDLESKPLGKPKTLAEARAMLQQLREQPHRVHTGIAIHLPSEACSSIRCVTTEVQMRGYTDAEIETYIATNDPMDKAGAYAIQHPEFHPVLRVDRCFANVVGLPLCAVATLLREWGLIVPINISDLCFTHFSYRCPNIDNGIRYTVKG
jgi:septum formation protein